MKNLEFFLLRRTTPLRDRYKNLQKKKFITQRS